MTAIAYERLSGERWDLLKHPLPGFIVQPNLNVDGVDWFNWGCAIPGPKHTIWEGGLFKLRISFAYNYPLTPPKCRFDPPIFHPNVFPSGTVGVSLYDKKKDWPNIRRLLLAIQDLLVNPKLEDPLQTDACQIYIQNRQEYNRRVREQAQRFPREMVQLEMLNY